MSKIDWFPGFPIYNARLENSSISSPNHFKTSLLPILTPSITVLIPNPDLSLTNLFPKLILILDYFLSLTNLIPILIEEKRGGRLQLIRLLYTPGLMIHYSAPDDTPQQCFWWYTTVLYCNASMYPLEPDDTPQCLYHSVVSVLVYLHCGVSSFFTPHNVSMDCGVSVELCIRLVYTALLNSLLFVIF